VEAGGGANRLHPNKAQEKEKRRMKYKDLLDEELAMDFLDGNRDERTGRLSVVHKYKPNVRLEMVMRMRKIKKHKEIFDKVRLGMAEEHGIVNKKEEECTPEQWAAFKADYVALLEKECPLHPKKWKAEELNLKDNVISNAVLDIVLEEQAEEPQEAPQE
jgi:hypothetical protein